MPKYMNVSKCVNKVCFCALQNVLVVNMQKIVSFNMFLKLGVVLSEPCGLNDSLQIQFVYT
jgi:hypothetical protein